MYGSALIDAKNNNGLESKNISIKDDNTKKFKSLMSTSLW